ncbi:hypothetical protein [Cytobacillus horneckiae]|uniref:hypothetical protein n=1 Tax=Cytobacillus horneckiae TaxID=549687 RepID=UPI003D9A40D4
MDAEILELLKLVLMAILSLQVVSILVFLVAEWAMVDFYKMGTFENPKSIFEKIPDFIMKFTFGMGFYLYSKFSKYNWLVRKLFLLIALIFYGIIAIIIFNLITMLLDLIFT